MESISSEEDEAESTSEVSSSSSSGEECSSDDEEEEEEEEEEAGEGKASDPVICDYEILAEEIEFFQKSDVHVRFVDALVLILRNQYNPGT